MAKKVTKKAVKVRRVKKKSWFEKFFTFPKIVVIGIVALSALTFYQVAMPQENVLGVTDNAVMYTHSEAIALAKKDMAAGKTRKMIAVYLWRDGGAGNNSGNASWDGDEECVKKQFTIKKNGTSKSPTQGDCNFPARYFEVTQDCNTIEFVKTNTSNKYTFTGFNITDKSRNDKPVRGSKTVRVCGFPETTGGDGWGFIYNKVQIGVKGS